MVKPHPLYAFLSIVGLAALMAMLFTPHAIAQARPQMPAQAGLNPVLGPEASYLSLARAYTMASVIARVSVRATSRVPRDTPPPGAGNVQVLLSVDVQGVLKARDPVPARLSYIYETKADARGRAPDLRKQTFLVFLEPVGSFDGAYRLVGPNPQRIWSQVAEDRLRAFGRELNTPQGAGYSVQALLGITDLDLASGPALGFIVGQKRSTPITLIMQKTNGVFTLRVSLSDTDLEGSPLMPESVLMYQLVCFLPRTLPEALLLDYAGEAGPTKAQRQAAARTAWASLTQQLGVCPS